MIQSFKYTVLRPENSLPLKKESTTQGLPSGTNMFSLSPKTKRNKISSKVRLS